MKAFLLAAVQNPLFTALVGVVVGFTICWATKPTSAIIKAREENLRQTENITRIHWDRVAQIEKMNTEQLQKWVVEQESQFMQHDAIRTLLHQQELQLTDTTTPLLWIALMAVLGTMGFVTWIIRDGNAEAVQTLHNAVAVLPALRASLPTEYKAEPSFEGRRELPADPPQDHST